MFAVLGGTPWRLILCEWQTLCLNADSQHLHPLFHFTLYTTVILIASFTSVFNGNICLGKQDGGLMALQAIAGLQGFFFPECLQPAMLFASVQSQSLERLN